MRIGILGGTFNPVHKGHIHIAKCAAKELCLNKVLFVPAYIPPHKMIKEKIDPADRVRMLRRAIADTNNFAVCLYEMDRKGKSYSVRTARFLKKKYGKNTELFFIVGSDSVKGLNKWKEISSLSRIVTFAVASRPGYGPKRCSVGAVYLKAPKKNISSTYIRKVIQKGRSAGRFLPAGVNPYIKMNNLYRGHN